MATEEGEEEPLPRVAPWRKILVALAGPAGNIMLAFLIAYVIFWVGKPSSPSEMSSVVGFVATNSTAYAEGLRIGDHIVAIQGATEKVTKVSSWQDVRIECALAERVVLQVEGADGEREMALATTKDLIGVRELAGVSGISFCKVLGTTPDSSAAKAGVQPNDLIVSLGGVKVLSISHLTHLVDAHRDEAVPLVVERKGEEVTLSVTPKYNEQYKRAMIGVSFNTFYMDSAYRVHPKPMDQIRGHVMPILRILKALVTPAEAKGAAGSLGGPFMIFWSLWMIIQSSLVMALWFTCFLNINLAILNLLPIPVLDGGHICFSLVEMTIRRPLPQKMVNALSFTFAVLLIGVMLLLSYLDIGKFIAIKKSTAGPSNEPAPSSAPAVAPAP